MQNEKEYKLKGQFVCFNGNFIRKNELNISLSNRAFKYGDGVFETIKVVRKEPLFYTQHLNRLVFALNTLKINYNLEFLKVEMLQKITRLLNANKYFSAVRIRITIYRNGEGLYTPESNEMQYLIEATELDSELYQLDKKGLKLGIYTETKKNYSNFSSFKTINSLPYILAGIYKTENNFDECLLQNDNNELIEGISSNIFILKGNSLFTPAINAGCIKGIMREIVVNIALSKNITVFDEAIIKEQDLLDADEIFLTNVIYGIKWVVSFQKKRYYNKFAKNLTDELNKLIS